MNDILNSLNDYVVNRDNMYKYTKDIDTDYVEKVKKKTTNNSTTNVKNKNFFIPYQEDKLFWIYYYIKHGYIEYNYVSSNSYSVEYESKINLIDKIKNNKSIFKDYKLKKIGDNISELMCNKEISFKTFLLICIVEKIR